LRTAIRVVLADDHTAIRSGLRVLLEAHGFIVVGEAGNGAEAVALVNQLQPDVLILDLGMPIKPGLDVIIELTAQASTVPILILTSATEDQPILAAMQAGATGYLRKKAMLSELLEAIHAVSQRKPYPDSSRATKIIHEYEQSSGMDDSGG